MDIYTAKELSEKLKISLPTLYGLVKRGEIRGFRVGKEWRFERAEVESWIKAQTMRASEQEHETDMPGLAEATDSRPRPMKMNLPTQESDTDLPARAGGTGWK